MINDKQLTDMVAVRKQDKPLPPLDETDCIETKNLREVNILTVFRLIKSLEKKISNGRIKDPDTEKIRLEYVKQMINACNCFNSMVKDTGYGSYTASELEEFVTKNCDILEE